jgi:hypothetical protein
VLALAKLMIAGAEFAPIQLDADGRLCHGHTRLAAASVAIGRKRAMAQGLKFGQKLSIIEMVPDESRHLDETALGQSQCRDEKALDETRDSDKTAVDENLN